MPRPTLGRALEAAVLVSALGLFVLLPPFITLFAAPVTVFGVPLMVVYVFGVWALLVLAAALLARRLDAGSDRDGDTDDPSEANDDRSDVAP